MGALDGLLNQVKQAITDHTADPKKLDASKLLSHVTDLFDKHPHNQVKPASQDPYGDPADQGGANPRGAPQNAKPASQDPYGDPADSRH
jgi:hypothetical protein